ncbi:hypothetical protein K7432_008173 [Basidiobolus ranarum]|uniref:Uncharacterized protein n=1 Tax=Basidiobolus ranarum TaxID=34480 RepID=A0ABR2VZI3_9FUNG
MRLQQLFLLSALVFADSAFGSRPTDVLRTIPSTYAGKAKFIPNAYIVEFDQHSDDTGVNRKIQEDFHSSLEKEGIRYTKRAEFTSVLNAVSINIESEHLERIANMANIKAVWPVKRYQKSTPVKAHKGQSLPASLIPSVHFMTGVDKVHKELKFTGAGIKVGVIDTGIDYTHPALGGCFGKGCRVSHGYDFISDTYDGVLDHIKTDDDPMDCHGHGTHVAGIIGANDPSFVGVAPDVTFGAYKVFDCYGGGPEDLIIKAVERAMKDKMDLINLSLGEPSPWSDDPVTRSLDKATSTGMVVIVALGNDGTNGIWTEGSPSTSRDSISTGSVDNARLPGQKFSVDQLKTEVFVAAREGLKPVTFKKTPIAGVEGNGCNPYETDVKGKLLVIKSGGCDNVAKSINASKAGALGIFIYSALDGALVPPSLHPNATIPIMGLEFKTAQRLIGALAKDKSLTLTFDKQLKLYPNPNGGQPSTFTSWGPDMELGFKPDFVSPGGNIYSTYPLALGSYAHLKGTSMASPYAAGTVALMLNAKGKSKKMPLHIRDLLRQTAKPIVQLGEKSLIPVARQGAGLINVYDAIQTDNVVSPSGVTLNDTTHFNAHRTLTIKNSGKKLSLYTLSHIPTLSVNGYDKNGYPVPQANITYLHQAASVRFSTRRISVKPGQSVKFNARFTPPRFGKDEKVLYSGFVVLTPRDPKSQVIRIPYTGLSGDLYSANMLDLNGPSHPLLLNKKTNKPETHFTLQEDSIPVVDFHLVHPTKELQLQVLDNKGRVLGSVLTKNGVRDARPRGYLGARTNFEFNGVITQQDKRGREREVQIKPGTYQFRLSVRKLFGDNRRKQDFETWVSPKFTITK